jgi:NAD(P)-dependent dehydrogenase (short-subunit alcohol dehydrogenase family)
LITGGASGLGFEITKVMASQGGNTVHFTYCHSEKEAGDMVKSLPNTRAIKCDFRNGKDIGRLLEDISEMDRDVLINNATLNIVVEHFNKMDPTIFIK